MNDLTDQELLQRYADGGCEAAFAVLVGRHIDWVHSAALRLVGEAHLAEDVTQAVFVAVARKAKQLQGCQVLACWLHRTTRNQAAMTVRGEVRRRHREHESFIMTHEPSDPARVWDILAPHLDEALGRLRPEDREAVLLRFFERRTSREIGLRLGLTEEAARKRVARALERLRVTLVKQGIAVSAVALGGVVASQAVQAAPAALASTVTAACLSTVTVGASLSTLGFLKIMASSQIKYALLSLTAAGLTTVSVVQYRTNHRLRAEIVERDHQLAGYREVPPVAPAPNNSEDAARQQREHLELLRLRGEVTDLRQRERERAAAEAAAATRAPASPSTSQAAAADTSQDFIPATEWNEVGAGNPRTAFQSFLAAVKTGDPSTIGSKVLFEVKWKNNVTEEDRQLVEKSKLDYIEMLQRAEKKLAGFMMSPSTDDGEDRTRVYFRIQKPDGTTADSNVEMVRVDNEWKPLLSMRWMDPDNASSFATSPVFGPSIDLEP